MAINGLGSFDMMSTYNRIGVTDQAISAASTVTEKPASESAVVDNKPQEEKQQPELKVNLNLEGMRRRSSFNLEDISRDFTKREPFSITSVDDQAMQSEMQKAVSEMEKDHSLQQFQDFVGGSNVILDNEDGTVIMK
ncbi:MAG: hypothetical protein Q4D29_01700 [Lachnospiraceae bacterium]|nr:hypothetical protein [Lachnospiraceae bacterium]